MKETKIIRNKLFALNPRFRHIPDGDRYLFALEQPKYKFNVIGVGSNGQEHIRVTNFEGRAMIHGVYDPNPLSVESAKEANGQFSTGGELVVYDSLEEACNDPEVDGLIISTPNYTHIDVMRVAVKSGKHILLEKPMATTVQDAHEIMQMAEAYEAVLQIGLQYRYKAMYAEAIYEGIERKSVGEIKTVSITKHRVPFLDKVNQWNKFSRFSGGTLVEKCCHYFDILNMFAGARPVSVYASGSMAVNFIDFEYEGEKSDIIDNALVVINYGNGIRANFNLSMISPVFHEEIILCGDAGWLKANHRSDFLSVPRPATTLEVLRGMDKPSRISSPSYPKQIEESGHSGATLYEHISFIDRIEGRETDAAKAVEGFWSIVVGAAAEESVKTGQIVTIADFLSQNGLDV